MYVVYTYCIMNIKSRNKNNFQINWKGKNTSTQIVSIILLLLIIAFSVNVY